MKRIEDEAVKRIGYEIRESDGEKEYSVLYGFSIIDHHVLMIVFYYDKTADKKWAVDTWCNLAQNI
jgi:hypothetical protein